jgi:succinate dehydrogenase iron-sulfur subunit
MADQIILEIARYSPEQDTEPHFNSYDVPVYKEWVVLDALNYIKDKVDGSLTYRWSCRMGICGSCGMMVNGEPKLTCATFLSAYAHSGNKVRVEPLRYFPVVRDLVTELTDFLVKLKNVKPWLIRKDEHEPALTEGEFIQTPEQLDKYKQFSMCINCTLCYAACPVVGLDPVFVGPAAIALAQRYNMDSRDQGADERMAVLAHPEGVWGCTFVGECTRVCPKHVDPAGAIQQYKLMAVLDWMKSFVMPRGHKSKSSGTKDVRSELGND